MKPVRVSKLARNSCLGESSSQTSYSWAELFGWFRWHQDVKPDNILVKSRPNASSSYDLIFVLADLGLSHFNVIDSDDKHLTDVNTYGTYKYGIATIIDIQGAFSLIRYPGAPETYRIDSSVEDVQINVTKTVDVWSLGCIFSEVATWVSYGWNQVEQYRMERGKEVARKLNHPEDVYLFHDGNKVLEAVEASHSYIEDGRRVDDFITLKVVREVIDDMLEDHRVRAVTLQALSYKAEKALRKAEKELRNFRTLGQVIGDVEPVPPYRDPLIAGFDPHHRTPPIPPMIPSIPLEASPMQSHIALPAYRPPPTPLVASTTSVNASPAESPPPEAANYEDSPPRISVREVLTWRQRRKNDPGVSRHLPNHQLLKSIEDRQSVRLDRQD